MAGNAPTAKARPAPAARSVVGVGLCVLDQLWRVDDLALRSTRTRYRERATAPGGMTAVALAQAARLGCRAQLLSMVGDDAEGRFVLRELRRHGVVTRRVVRSDRFPTTVATVLVHRRSGERRFLVADRRPLERAAPEFDVAPVRRAGALLVDGHFGRNALSAARLARERGAPVVGDFSDARPAVRRLLPFVDHPIVPFEFAALWGAGGPRETLRDLHRRFGGTPVITLGAKGALALVAGRIHPVAPHRVRVRDTTGAGDAFHGAFAAGLAQGLDVLEALALASRWASLCCTALGGTGHLDGPGPGRGSGAR